MLDGYEIHQGRSVIEDECVPPMIYYADGTTDGCVADERCMGSYMHGVLDHDEMIDRILAPYKKDGSEGAVTDYAAFKESQYDLLAERVREYLDMDKLYEIMGAR